MLVFKYLLRVFKYLSIAYNNHPVKKCIVINYCEHIRPIHDFAELSEDQRHMSKIFWSLQYVVETQILSISLSIITVSRDWPVSNVEYNNLLKVVSGQSRK